jgi:TonB family protein
MSYRALLFCADEKASRAVTQVFRELDFYVETSNEPFDAVKRLTAHHFDALVVDCDNEENATLLFKSARNSASNNNSLAVAVVEGQANIAKAFRLGANLVLTKPINLEQAKGTLRVARGLLRKAEANKVTAAAAETPVEQAAPVFQKTVLTPVPVEVAAPAPLPQTETEAIVQEASATAEAYLESLQKSVAAEAKAAPVIHAAAAAAAAAPAKESRWASKPEILEPKPVSADDAKKPKKKEEAKTAGAINRRTDISGKPDTQRFSTLGISEGHAEATAQASKKNFWIAAVIVLALGGGAYFAWAKYHPAIQLPFVGQTETPTPAPPAPQTPKAPVAEAAPAPDATATTAAPEVKTEDPAPAPGPLKPPALVKVPDSVAEGLLIKRVDPNYPDQARGQKIDGLVQLSAKINKLGDVTEVKALHGNPLLIDAATQAVKQWKYRAYTLNGAPVNIETGVTLTLKP